MTVPSSHKCERRLKEACVLENLSLPLIHATSKSDNTCHCDGQSEREGFPVLSRNPRSCLRRNCRHGELTVQGLAPRSQVLGAWFAHCGSWPLSGCMRAKSLQSCSTLWPYGLQPSGLLCPWDSPGRNTGVGGRALLQGIFPTQGLNPGSSCIGRWVLYHERPPGSPSKLEVITYNGRGLPWVMTEICIANS